MAQKLPKMRILKNEGFNTLLEHPANTCEHIVNILAV